MLKGIDPVLTGELLKVLDEMGHGDQLVVADRNFPALAAGAPVIRLGEVGTVRVVESLLTLFPLDAFIAHPIARMEVRDDPAQSTPVQDAVLALAREELGSPVEYETIPRLEFYERIKAARVVVQSLEAEPYSCFILTKGVVWPEGAAPAPTAHEALD